MLAKWNLMHLQKNPNQLPSAAAWCCIGIGSSCQGWPVPANEVEKGLKITFFGNAIHEMQF